MVRERPYTWKTAASDPYRASSDTINLSFLSRTHAHIAMDGYRPLIAFQGKKMSH